MPIVDNPVLRGFHPDPSLLRVGDDYYIATSTFEWFPGVQIAHSRDLVYWRAIANPLARQSQLDLRGCPNSGGIWAPCLSWCDGTFFLIYTVVRHWAGSFKDAHNYLVTAPSIEGPWSEPVYLNSSGFDPSLFHDDDGRKWLVNMLWDHRPGHNAFGGILLQEYDAAKQSLVGPVGNIFAGTELGLVEGPHLYKVDGWYYLLVAEGGTFLTHAATVARSRDIAGPYEAMPGNPLVSSNRDPGLRLQSAGHGSLVRNADGSWLLAHLCRRPLGNGRSILGRETALQPVEWKDGWPRLAGGGSEPRDRVAVPQLPAHPWPAQPVREVFDGERLPPHWMSPRVGFDGIASLAARKGRLRLYGRESIVSRFEQSLVARRQQAFHVEASTCVEFHPDNFQQMAGLVAFYNTDGFYYLYLTHAPHSRRCLGLMKCEKGVVSELIEKQYPLDDWESVCLKLAIDGGRIRFFYSPAGGDWHAAGWEQDASILSDEHAVPCGFTGNFVGMACQDLSGARKPADFAWFEYRELDAD
ncbi:glycoside hydrolase family 43 protein [Pseudoxanthomonas sangjuensis]|uniref:glycoside hydrolase family 43 protein n=1 Tax=Pseudoxanthomonas sangjuensis TaxID=1503750 RepID=UPI00139160B9|nr:glycoside hydrolase family 43 protein [Pseudoxanthomonas sangjuensis]KAF1714494.1 glycoside hydrolase 43 family protein [Pseudoxanthomonas sangjuensis]